MHGMQRIALGLMFAAMAACALGGSAEAAERGRPFAPEPAAIGAEQAAVIARNETGGRVLDVRPIADAGHSAYAVRVLLGGGRVRTIVVDGRSGQLR